MQMYWPCPLPGRMHSGCRLPFRCPRAEALMPRDYRDYRDCNSASPLPCSQSLSKNRTDGLLCACCLVAVAFSALLLSLLNKLSSCTDLGPPSVNCAEDQIHQGPPTAPFLSSWQVQAKHPTEWERKPGCCLDGNTFYSLRVEIVSS